MATKVSRNNTSFPALLKEALSKVPYDKKSNKTSKELMYHQKLKQAYMLNHPEQRGLYIIDDPGYGKTRSAAAIAEDLITQGYKVLVLAASSLHANTRNGVLQHKRSLKSNDKRTDAELLAEIDKQYTFVSLNASNMAEQISRVAKTGTPRKKKSSAIEDTDIDLINIDEKLESFLGQITSLEGYVVIVDEAHNLFNSVVSGSQNAKKFYEIIMNSKKIKLIFLSGTPIINDPFELVPCFNMLHGYHTLNGQKVTLFPEDWEEFHRYFVDQQNGHIRNKDKFQDRIFGLVSYNGILYEQGVKSQTGRKDVIAKAGFPDEAPTIVEKIPMSKKQYTEYILLRHKEEQENNRTYGRKAKVPMEKPGSLGSSTYRVATRQVSNMLLPTNVSKEKNISEVHAEDWKALDVYSPKYARIIENMLKYPMNIVYSQFKGIQGIGGLAKAMDAIGYIEYDLKSNPKLDKKSDSKSGGKGINRTFVRITGDVDPEKRQELLNILKSKVNKNGDIINELLVTAAGAEGIDTNNMRATHMMEPYWNPAREDQFKYRAIRIQSHDELPAKERIVQPYIYLSLPPLDVQKEALEKKRIIMTTDMELYSKAKAARKVIQSFRYAQIEATLDCLLLANVKEKGSKGSKDSIFQQEGLSCKICQPTNEQLFHDDFLSDMKTISPCKPYIEDKITVKEVLVDGKKYYYKKPTSAEEATGYGLEIYEYSEVLDAYSPIDPADDLYMQIAAKIK